MNSQSSNGRERWVHATGRTFFEDGVPVRFVGTAQGITDRKRADEAVLRLAAIVASSEDAIVSKDLNGIIMSWNQGAERIFGYQADEVFGKPIAILIPPDRPNEEPEILRRIRQGRRVEHYETVRRRMDGTLIDISLTVSPVKDPKGRIIGVSKIARDITERKRTERDLQEAKDAAEAANRSKDKLLAMLSHELRTPPNTGSDDRRGPRERTESASGSPRGHGHDPAQCRIGNQVD